MRLYAFSPRLTPASSQDFLDELATNASQHGVGIVFYSGNNDMLLPHLGTLGE